MATAAFTPRPWNWASAVTVCQDCEGTGMVASQRLPTIDDPYPETDCECGLGEHEPCCEVCGFNQIVSGYDCVVCETVASLTDKDFAAFKPAAFAEAVAVAVATRAAEARRLAA